MRRVLKCFRARRTQPDPALSVGNLPDGSLWPFDAVGDATGVDWKNP